MLCEGGSVSPHAVGVQHQAGWRAPHPGPTHSLYGAINRLPPLGRQDLEGGFLGCLPRALGVWPHPQPEPGPVALRCRVEGPLKGLRQAQLGDFTVLLPSTPPSTLPSTLRPVQMHVVIKCPDHLEQKPTISSCKRKY